MIIFFGVIVVLLIGLLILGLSQKTNKEEDTLPTPDDMEPAYYTSEDEIPTETYCIVHQTEDGIRYYPLYSMEKTVEDGTENPSGADPENVIWVNYNVDEGLIPTFYQGDKLIYKSQTYIPTKYYAEKYADQGYTIGVSGLQKDLSGNYQYIKDSSHVLFSSDAAGFESLDGESVYLVSVGDTLLRDECVTESGTVSGLTFGSSYPCDIRTGTQKIDASLTANVHYFTLLETYCFSSFTFITDIIAEINIPDYMTTGYYKMNNAGVFRYLKEESDYKKLNAEDYNKTFYKYDESGSIEGTIDGRVLDEEGFVVNELLDDDIMMDSEGETEDKYEENEDYSHLWKEDDDASDNDGLNDTDKDENLKGNEISLNTELETEEDD